MKLEVITDVNAYERAMPAPHHDMTMAECKDLVKGQLADASGKGEKTACLRSIRLAEKTSDNFQLIGWIEQAVKEYQAEHDMPETVRIVCDSDASAEQYKVVYNMFYADSKTNRLQDDKWD